MRTTIDLPDRLFRRIKARSALQGLTIKKFITRALERELSNEMNNATEKRVKLPVVPSKNPGKLKLTSEKIAKILEEEDINVSS